MNKPSKIKAYVTGIGIVSPLGEDIKTYWSNLISGKSSIKKITKFDATNYKCQVACEVPQGNEDESSFIAEQWIEKKDI